MNKNIFIVLVGGFLVAVLVAVMVQATLSGSKPNEEELERVEILIAAKDLKVGRELRSGDLKWQVWPEDTLFIGAITRNENEQPAEAVTGKILRNLSEGQPVHMSLVAEDDKGDFLSANVLKGMRAVGVSVRSHILADRLFRPGDFVDVMVTYRVRINGRTNPEAKSLVSRYATETVIENVRILAIDNNDTKAIDEEEDGKKKKKKKSSKKASVTLEVTPDAAEQLVLADRMGDIGFALRSIGDNGDQGTDRRTTDVSMSKVLTDLAKMSGGSSAVRIYNGINMQEARARNAEPDQSVDFGVEDAPAVNQTIIIEPGALGGLSDEE